MFAIVSAAGFLVMAFTIVSLVNTRTVFGWALPPDMPPWVGILIAVVMYHVLTWPFHAARHAALSAARSQAYGWLPVWDGVLWLGIISLVGWLAYAHLPEVHDGIQQFLQNLPAVWREIRRPG